MPSRDQLVQDAFQKLIDGDITLSNLIDGLKTYTFTDKDGNKKYYTNEIILDFLKRLKKLLEEEIVAQELISQKSLTKEKSTQIRYGLPNEVFSQNDTIYDHDKELGNIIKSLTE